MRNEIPFALGAVLLGLVGFAFGDFARQWQPVPDGAPAHKVLADISASILALSGMASLWRRTATVGALVLTLMYASWVIVLHAPLLAARPTRIAEWNGTAEVLALTAGALMLFAVSSAAPRDAIRLIARITFGVCPLVFGLAHFAYADFTAAFIPAWIPFRLFWAYATGVAHIAGGLAVLSGVLGRLGATFLAIMYALFALLVHAPRLIAEPTSHLNWLLLAVTLSLSGAAWLMRLGFAPSNAAPA